MIPRASRRDHDRALHSWMQAARIGIGSGLREGEFKRVVRIERLGMELALAADNAMGDVVAIAEDDRCSGLHRELIWGKGKVVDIHLVTGGDRGQG